MNRTNQILIGILIIQLVIGVFAFFPGSEEHNVGGPLLPDFNADAVMRLTFRAAEGEDLVLAKVDGTWVLPEADDFPADEFKVNSVLDKIAALTADRLIARSGSSHRRLGVSNDNFEALVEIEQEGRVDDLYIGTSAGANATHMRVDDSDDVYLTSGLSSWEANNRVGLWIDTLYFSVDVESIVGFTLQNANGVFDFQKVGDEWVMLGLAAEDVFDPSKLTVLLNQISSVRMREPLGVEEDAAYGMDSPQAVITVIARESMSTGEADEETDPGAFMDVTYTLRIGALLEDEGHYVLASSTSDYFVILASYTAENFVEKTRDYFLEEPEEELGEDLLNPEG